jgi:hypothetical protein
MHFCSSSDVVALPVVRLLRVLGLGLTFLGYWASEQRAVHTLWSAHYSLLLSSMPCMRGHLWFEPLFHALHCHLSLKPRGYTWSYLACRIGLLGGH